MATAFLLSRRPYILFRVECHDLGHPRNNCTFRHRSLVARYPTRVLDIEAFNDYLSWTHRSTPCISFFSTWHRTMAWRKWLIQQGATNVIVIAVWSKDLLRVYSAYDVAHQLQYTSYHNGDLRRQLDHHLDEFLVCHSIHADEYRILAIFYRNIREEFVSFSL